MSKAATYICQRAAHAILPETLRISTDGLFYINSFIDEFLFMLLTTTKPIHVLNIKTNIQLKFLPNTLGRNALIEADVELMEATACKQGTEYEISAIQTACAQHCTLSDYKSPSSDTVVIYLTAIVEHMAEYLLASIADQTEGDYIRVRDVLIGLSNDSKVNHLFHKMNLKKQLQKKVTPTALLSIHNETKFESSSTIHSSTASSRKSIDSDTSSKSSKKRFSFFHSNKKKTRQSNPPSFPTNTLSSPHPSPLATDFECLFQSGQTKKVSLTPSRLKSIEITQEQPAPVCTPPLTPASSLASRPSQRSRQSVILEEETIERPSSSVFKRISVGTRPPSFHECLITKQDEFSKSKIENQGLVYLVPSTLRHRVKTTHRACQTEDTIEEDDQEEWLIEDCNNKDEEYAVEWLLGFN
ncbi:hypothetical protein G6F46_012285 [Rhizopus delemar]|uniref:Uncharacterized protein n=2 Tax=Rhizopus TaxID=4842 RepID=A0A9P6YRF7_9FUNG|nr:hypothetical protein G6F55_012026 [Rhizopus delemar]KAG1533889.1 hypothetical protein G6F51_012391 [Rhizopus arrhizus]KAG1488273.1 hypothetical protein G6F54_012162 [Rhizopus delemar]KAG1496275.1 hypothetical protein G6F53_012205 [Rhizopus delemar]KAG1509002.1 hypothetical protein G6F52_011249 [Rhizopus delemar]